MVNNCVITRVFTATIADKITQTYIFSDKECYCFNYIAGYKLVICYFENRFILFIIIVCIEQFWVNIDRAN